MTTPLEEKIKEFSLFPLTAKLVPYLKEINEWFSDEDTERFSYIKFYKGRVYFYTKDYIENSSLEEINKSFERISK